MRMRKLMSTCVSRLFLVQTHASAGYSEQEVIESCVKAARIGKLRDAIRAELMTQCLAAGRGQAMY